MNDELASIIAQGHHSGGDGTALSPQQQPAPRPFCSFGWEQRSVCRNGPPVNGELANSVAQGHHSGDDGTAPWPKQQPGPRPFCRFGWEQRGACRNGPPVNGGLTLAPPIAVISDSVFEEWRHSDEFEMPMFSLLEGQLQQPPTRTALSTADGPQQPAPTAVALAAAAPAAAAVTGPRVFPAVSSKGVAEAPGSSAGAASAAVPAAAPATGGIVSPTASVGGGGQGARFCR